MNLKGVLAPFSALKQLGKAPHTVNYPLEKKPAADRYRGFHFNDLEECIGCGTCGTICQNGAIDMIQLPDLEGKKGDSGLRPRVDNGRCCWCGLCVDVCPTGSLSLTQDYLYVTEDPDSFLWTPGVDNPDGHKIKSFFPESERQSLLDYARIPMPELEGLERVKSFAEVVLGYTEEEARAEAARCISCGLCVEACPEHMHIPEYINAIARGEDEAAVNIIYDNNPLGEMCGKVCTRRCEDVCSIAVRGEPIAIRWLKRYATEQAGDKDIIREMVDPEIQAPNGRKVGIVGAGPSGLTAGYYLALRGYDVSIYESKAHAGGMTMYGIPKYRLPMESLNKQIEYLQSVGVKMNFNTKVGQDITFEELQKQYDALFMGIGFEIPYTLGIKGEEHAGSIQAVNFLRDVNAGRDVEIGKKVVVIGGGNVAIDGARIARRFDDAEVTILYRRRVEDMPADWEEIEGAEDEGVKIVTQAIPLEILADEKGVVSAIRYGMAEMVDDGKGGRPRPRLIEGEEHTMEVDTIIGAIGQEADYSFIPESVRNQMEFQRGRIVTDELKETKVPGIFAGGDIANNTADAISAIADGFRAVKGIERYFAGERVS